MRIGLFDKGLFDRWGILTSRGIQRSYWRVLAGRRSKVVYREYWLLADDECQGLVKINLESNRDLANDHVQLANDDVPATNGGKNSTVQNSTVQSFKNNPAEPVLSPTEEFYRSKIGTVTDKIREGLAEMVSEDGETEVNQRLRSQPREERVTLAISEGSSVTAARLRQSSGKRTSFWTTASETTLIMTHWKKSWQT